VADFMRDEIFASLNAARDNGYDQIHYNTALEVAQDIAEYDQTFEGIEPNLLVPAIKEWQKEHALDVPLDLDVHGQDRSRG